MFVFALVIQFLKYLSYAHAVIQIYWISYRVELEQTT